jgi:hypothetical protein
VASASVARRLDIDLDLQSRLAEIIIRRFISSARASVTGTLGGSHKAHDCDVVDVASRAFPVDVPSADNLADLVGSV